MKTHGGDKENLSLRAGESKNSKPMLEKGKSYELLYSKRFNCWYIFEHGTGICIGKLTENGDWEASQ